MYTNRRLTFGSRLFEYFVVVSVVTIVGGGSLVFLGDALARARDAQRVADVVALRTAFELYHTEHGAYPQVAAESTEANWQLFDEHMSPYLSALPRDPRNSDGYGYVYRATRDAQTGRSDYALVVRFERPAEVALAAQVRVAIVPDEHELPGTVTFSAP